MSDLDDLVSRWRPYTYRWECPTCGRRLGCPAALDAHQLDHDPSDPQAAQGTVVA